MSEISRDCGRSKPSPKAQFWQIPIIFPFRREICPRPVRHALRRQPGILPFCIRLLWLSTKSRRHGPLHGDRRSVEASKPRRKGELRPSFAAGLCRAFSNVRTRLRESSKDQRSVNRPLSTGRWSMRDGSRARRHLAFFGDCGPRSIRRRRTSFLARSSCEAAH
jgi:hypothetical protein